MKDENDLEDEELVRAWERGTPVQIDRTARERQYSELMANERLAGVRITRVENTLMLMVRLLDRPEPVGDSVDPHVQVCTVDVDGDGRLKGFVLLTQLDDEVLVTP